MPHDPISAAVPADFRTEDPHAAGFLLHKGHTLLSVEPSAHDRRRCAFRFRASPRIQSDLDEWYDPATLELRRFASALDDAYRALKARLRALEMGGVR